MRFINPNVNLIFISVRPLLCVSSFWFKFENKEKKKTHQLLELFDLISNFRFIRHTHGEEKQVPVKPPRRIRPSSGRSGCCSNTRSQDISTCFFFLSFFLKIHIAAAAAVYRVCVCVLIQLITYPFLSGPLYTHTSCLVASSIDWMCVCAAYTDKEQSRKRTRVETFRRNVFIDRNKLENEKTHTENIFIGATNFSI